MTSPKTSPRTTPARSTSGRRTDGRPRSAEVHHHAPAARRSGVRGPGFDFSVTRSPTPRVPAPVPRCYGAASGPLGEPRDQNLRFSEREGVLGMAWVRVRENEPIDSAIRRFKKQCAKAGILQELRKRQHYDKPSVRRKKKAVAARKRAIRRTARNPVA